MFEQLTLLGGLVKAQLTNKESRQQATENVQQSSCVWYQMFSSRSVFKRAIRKYLNF